MKTDKKGSTLIEVILTVIILSIFIIAGASFNIYASLWIGMYENKAQALQVANNRLEELEAFLPNIWSDPVPSPPYPIYYISQNGTSWAISGNNPGETVNINGVSMPITTTAQWVDVTPGVPAYIAINVTVRYKRNPNQDLALQTYI